AEPGHAFYSPYDDSTGRARAAPPLAADVDGDGLDDLVVYALSTEFNPGLPVVAALYPSPIGARAPVYFGVYLGSEYGPDVVATSKLLQALGDLDNDTIPDLVLGQTILSGPLVDLPPPDRDTCMVAYDYALANQATGSTATWLGDLDDDGDNDLLIAGDGEGDLGAVQLLLGAAAI
ncbi:MAG: FG-GAP repeat protein, partial [Deltaproteobacteria bacterium]|nr:FG-GAP repeat protein [Deltaproteobacteria bacterium]